MCTRTVKGKKDVDARRKMLEVLRLIRVYQKPELWNDVSSLILDHRELDVHNVLTPDNIEDLIYVITNDVASGDITKLKFVTCFYLYARQARPLDTLIYAPLLFKTKSSLMLYVYMYVVFLCKASVYVFVLNIHLLEYTKGGVAC